MGNTSSAITHNFMSACLLVLLLHPSPKPVPDIPVKAVKDALSSHTEPVIKMPKSVQSRAKEKIHDIYLAPTREQSLVAYNAFISLYHTKFEKACECLTRDKDVLFTFYDFPCEHWVHIRSTNVIESVFATVRLRTNKTKGCGSRLATLTMVFKLTREAQKTWQRIKGYKLIPHVINGTRFVDGEIEDKGIQVA